MREEAELAGRPGREPALEKDERIDAEEARSSTMRVGGAVMVAKVRVTAVRCMACGYDMKSAYQSSGGELDGEDWECEPRGVMVFNRIRCLRCGGPCTVESEPTP